MLSRLRTLNWLEIGVVFFVAVAFYTLHFHHYFDTFSSQIFFFNDADDAKIYQWNTWHFAHQIKEGNSIFYTDYICTPKGTSLWMHAYTLWFGMLNLFLNDIELSINLGIAIQLVVAFIGFYFLAKRFVMRPYFAGVVAYISVFNTYILAKVGVHYNLVLIGLLPFLLLLIFKLFSVENNSIRIHKKYFIWFLLLLILAFFMDYYVVFYAMAFLAVYLLWYGMLSKWFDTWNWKKTSLVVMLFGMGHVLLRGLRISGFDERGAVWGSADFRLLFSPSSNSENLKEWVIQDIPNTLNDNKIFIGFGVIVYLIVALTFFYSSFRQDREARFFLFSSVVFLLVTLPVIKIAGKDLFYNFTAIVHYIPFVNNVRAPDRFILLFFISASLFICRLVFLETYHTSDWRKYVGFSLSILVLSFLDHSQQKMKPVQQPQASVLLQNCKDKTVLMLPFGIRDGYQSFGDFDENQALLQTQYAFKMPSGYLSRLHDETWKFYTTNTFYKNLVELQEDKSVSDFNWHLALHKNKIQRLYVSKSYLAKHKSVEEVISELPALPQEDEIGILFTFYK